MATKKAADLVLRCECPGTQSLEGAISINPESILFYNGVITL